MAGQARRMLQLLRTDSIDARIVQACLLGRPVTNRVSLANAKVSWRAIKDRLVDGRLHQAWTPVLLVGTAPEEASYDTLLAAALSTTRDGSVLDGTTALHHRGIWTRHDDSIHVASPHMHRPEHEYRVSFHRMLGISSGLVKGLPTRTGVEALFLAAMQLTPHQLANVIKNAVYQKQFTVEELIAELQRRPGFRNVSTVRRALELHLEGSAGTKSFSEDRLLPVAVARFGEPLVNVFGATGMPDYEPDFCWPDLRWIIEIDGDQHRLDPVQRARDAARDAQLRASGWKVFRVPYRDVWSNPELVIERALDYFTRP
jgi:hypothetical protein